MVFFRTDNGDEPISPTEPAPPDPPLQQPLRLVVVAAVGRLKVSQRSPALPRLPEALRRLYGALQRHGGRAMVQLFDAVGAMVEGGDSVMRSHLSSLVAEAEQPGGGAAAGASLPRLQATARGRRVGLPGAAAEPVLSRGLCLGRRAL